MTDGLRFAMNLSIALGKCQTSCKRDRNAQEQTPVEQGKLRRMSATSEIDVEVALIGHNDRSLCEASGTLTIIHVL